MDDDTPVARARAAIAQGAPKLGGDDVVILATDMKMMLEAIEGAHSILSRGKPPRSQRELNARRLLRLIGARKKD